MAPHLLSGIFVTLTVLSFVMWALGGALSKGGGLNQSLIFKTSVDKFIALVLQRPLLFGSTLLIIVAMQPLLLQTKGSLPSMLGAIASGTAAICMIACQIATFKSNSKLFEPGGELAWRNSFLIGYNLCLLHLFLYFGGIFSLLFFVLPAILFKIYTFVSTPVSVCETKSVGAVLRSLKLCKSHFWDICKISMPYLICINAPMALLSLVKHGVNDPVLLAASFIVIRLMEFLANVLSWQCQSFMYDYLRQSAATVDK